VGLPLNRQYKASDGASPENLPSHQVDHNTRGGYTSEVDKYLTDNVWNSLAAKQAVHEVDVASMKKALEDGSDEFRRRIDDRGQRKGGTKICWQHRFDAAYESLWYHPFSMGKKPSRRYPGVSYAELTNVFAKLG
jgi:hypothetical protein